MTLGNNGCAGAPAVPLEIEPFSEYAYSEISECPLTPPGVCGWPDCSQQFEPLNLRQTYCCKACRKADEQEHRKFGHKIAVAMLAHQNGRHAQRGDPRFYLASVARTFVSRAQSDWLKNRKMRIEIARVGND